MGERTKMKKKRQQEPPLPPHNIEAEMAVLGSILLGGSDGGQIRKRILTRLRREHFWLERHRIIYEAMLAVNERGRPPDFLIVGDELEQRGQLEQAGHLSYLTALTLAPGSWLNGEYYSDIVARLARERRAREIGLKLYAASQRGLDDRVNQLRSELDALGKEVQEAEECSTRRVVSFEVRDGEQ